MLVKHYKILSLRILLFLIAIAFVFISLIKDCLIKEMKTDFVFLRLFYFFWIGSLSQSYKINLVLKKSKLVLNLLTVRYINIDQSIVLLQSELR